MIKPPKIDADTVEFWAGAARGELRIQRCGACGVHQFYPRVHCTTCDSFDLGWVTASGRGTIYTYTVCHRKISDLDLHTPPYVVALIDLDEGVRMLSNVVDPAAATEGALIGRRVQAAFVDTDAGFTLPVFELA